MEPLSSEQCSPLSSHSAARPTTTHPQQTGRKKMAAGKTMTGGRKRKRTAAAANAPAPVSTATAAPTPSTPPPWIHLPHGVLYTVFDALDMPSLARLRQASSELDVAVGRWASVVAKRDWAAVPYGARVDDIHSIFHTLSNGAPAFPPARLPLSCLQYLRHMGPDLIEQQRYLSLPDGLEKAQSQARQAAVYGEGGGRISNGLRRCLAGWMWSYSFLSGFNPAVAHAAVSLLDRALCFTVPASKVTLLGSCCLMIESYRVPQPSKRLRLVEVEHLTDHEYPEAEILAMIEVLLARPISQVEESLSPLLPAESLPPLLGQGAGEDYQAAFWTYKASLQTLSRCPWKSTAHGFLHQHLLQRGVTPLTAIKAPPADVDVGVAYVSEEAVLAQLLIDLSLLEGAMAQGLPSTVAASAIFLSRITLDHLSRAPLTRRVPLLANANS